MSFSTKHSDKTDSALNNETSCALMFKQSKLFSAYQFSIQRFSFLLTAPFPFGTFHRANLGPLPLISASRFLDELDAPLATFVQPIQAGRCARL